MEWKPMSSAPKDGTTIIIYWFATCRFFISQWDLSENMIDYAWCHENGCIAPHIKKIVWTEMIQHPEYKDYQHLFN